MLEQHGRRLPLGILRNQTLHMETTDGRGEKHRIPVEPVHRHADGWMALPLTTPNQVQGITFSFSGDLEMVTANEAERLSASLSVYGAPRKETVVAGESTQSLEDVYLYRVNDTWRAVLLGVTVSQHRGALLRFLLIMIILRMRIVAIYARIRMALLV